MDLDLSRFSQRIRTIDMHTGGEPLRIVTNGYPPIPGRSILEKRQYVKTHLDHLRKFLMWEPRGHADMYGCLVVEPNDSEAHFGVIFMHNAGYSSMCGHAIIALAKLAVELGWVKAEREQTSVSIDAPCGRIKALVSEDGSVEFEGVPSFILSKNVEVELNNGKSIFADIAYGGAFYAYVNIDQFDFGMEAAHYQSLLNTGRMIKQKIISSSLDIDHPFEEDLSFLYGTIFYSSVQQGQHQSKNVCVFANGEVDRSPTGSGVCGRMALHYLKGEIQLDDILEISSIVGSRFTGRIKATETYGPHHAIVPLVKGEAFISGVHEFVLDPKDSIQNGFLLR